MSNDKDTLRLVTNAIAEICKKTGGTFIGTFTVGQLTAGLIAGQLVDPKRTDAIVRIMGGTVGGYVNTMMAAANLDADVVAEAINVFGEHLPAHFEAGIRRTLEGGERSEIGASQSRPYKSAEEFAQSITYIGAPAPKDGGK